MGQIFLQYGLSDEARIKAVSDELSRRGYIVAKANRQIRNAVTIRVREGTADEAEVTEVVRKLDPGATAMPKAAPTMGIREYREGL